MDITSREVYEIKPRSSVREGMEQLCANYVGPWNAVAYVSKTKPIRPGTEWRPSPLYWLPPDYILATVTCPGLIVYDVFRAASLPPQYAGEPIWSRSFNRERFTQASRELSTAAAVVLILAILAVAVLFAVQPELIPLLLTLAL